MIRLSNTDNFIDYALSKGYSVTFKEDVNGYIAHVKYKDKNVVVPYEDVKNHGIKFKEYIKRKLNEL